MAALMGSLGFISPANAARPATLSLSNTSGDAVRVSVTGDPEVNVQLSFLPPGASTVTSFLFGATDASGALTNTISSGAYAIPAGSPVYVSINGMQSATSLWPAYASTLVLEKSSVQAAVGQSVTVSGSNSLILAANSSTANIGTAISGSQATITGLAEGAGTVILCATNAGCQSLAVNVGGVGQTQVSFNLNNIVMNYADSKTITIFGGGNNGFRIKANTNSASVNASIAGTSDIISLYATRTAGTTAIEVCAANDDSNCASLNITNLGESNNKISFSQNNLNLIPGLNQSISVSGGPDNNYFISSNSNSGVVSAVMSGNTITVTGGSNTGTAVIVVCSATTNNLCGNLNITTNANTTTPSAVTLSFSQNVVAVAATDTSNVTVSGGTGTGYVISGNTHPEKATAIINGSVVAVTGVAVGSTQITVCSASVSTTCASFYVNISAASTKLSFSKTSIGIASGEKQVIIINGATSTASNVITSNTSSVVQASLSNNGGTLIITGGTVAGTTNITVCAGSGSSNCATIQVTNTVPSPQANTNSNTNTSTDTGNTNSNQAVLSEKETAASVQLGKILAEASNILSGAGITKDLTLEGKINTAYVKALVAGAANSETASSLITRFIAYGTETTKILGEGERAGVISSYKKAFGKLPATEAEWQDAIKIANGRWPGAASSSALESAKKEFKKVYNREANMNNGHDNAAVSIIAYGLRPTARNTNSEKAAIKTFKSIYGHNPSSSLAWDIVRAIAYSGATR